MDVADAIHSREDDLCATDLRQFGVGGSLRDEPAPRKQLAHGVRGSHRQNGALCYAREGRLALGGII